MKSSKTEILSFDIDEYNSRECKVHNRGFYLGEQSKQGEVYQLQTEIDEYKEVAESMDDAYLREKSRVDELQKRIDEAWIWCEKGCILKAMEILKGD